MQSELSSAYFNNTEVRSFGSKRCKRCDTACWVQFPNDAVKYRKVLTILEHPLRVFFPFAFTFCKILGEQIKFCILNAGFGDRTGNLIPLPSFNKKFNNYPYQIMIMFSNASFIQYSHRNLEKCRKILQPFLKNVPKTRP